MGKEIKNLCISCGAEIPEGRQVCPHCESVPKDNGLTAADVIKELRAFIEQESKFIPDIHTDGLLDRLVKKINELEQK